MIDRYGEKRFRKDRLLSNLVHSYTPQQHVYFVYRRLTRNSKARFSLEVKICFRKESNELHGGFRRS